jgi:hypothetical protein
MRTTAGKRVAAALALALSFPEGIALVAYGALVASSPRAAAQSAAPDGPPQGWEIVRPGHIRQIGTAYEIVLAPAPDVSGRYREPWFQVVWNGVYVGSVPHSTLDAALMTVDRHGGDMRRVGMTP